MHGERRVAVHRLVPGAVRGARGVEQLVRVVELRQEPIDVELASHRVSSTVDGSLARLSFDPCASCPVTTTAWPRVRDTSSRISNTEITGSSRMNSSSRKKNRPSDPTYSDQSQIDG